LDPDIIVGHNFTNFDLDILLHRMKKFNILNWSRLGRRRKTDWPKIQFGAGGSSKSGYGEQLVMCGRLVCDTYIASQDLVRSKSYRLSDLALSQLNITRNDFGPKEIELYSKRGNLNCEMARHCTFDAYLAFALMTKLQILPLSKKLTNLSGNLW
jgi:DNA polymerase alpha subunit A